MTLLALDTVYSVLQSEERQDPYNKTLFPSFTVEGGTADLFISNSLTKPANDTEMILDTAGLSGIQGPTKLCKWVLFKSASGTPVVNDDRWIRN